jgi:hypothetical protein
LEPAAAIKTGKYVTLFVVFVALIAVEGPIAPCLP